MGFAVLHYDKQTGASPGLSKHIERGCYLDGKWVEWHPTNADASRTRLNRELIDGKLSRDERITKRIKDALGDKFKPKKNQVRALTLIMSASCEDMQRIMDEGKFDDWCMSSIRWAQQTHGEENVVSAVLHMDEKTPHLHVTVVPIVQGMSKDQAYKEKKARKAEEEGIKQKKKRKYKKQDPSANRLCAADVMARTKLKDYQTTYAEAVQEYGLTRGIEGSIAKHIDINDWYKSLVTEVQNLERELNEKKSQIETLNEQAASLEKEHDELSEVIAKKENHREVLSKSIDADIETLRPYLGDLGKLLDNLDAYISEIEYLSEKGVSRWNPNKDLKNLKCKAQTLSKSVREIIPILATSGARIDQAEEGRAKAETERDNAIRDKETFRKENSVDELKKQAMDEHIARIKAENLLETEKRHMEEMEDMINTCAAINLSANDITELLKGKEVSVSQVCIKGIPHQSKDGKPIRLKWKEREFASAQRWLAIYIDKQWQSLKTWINQKVDQLKARMSSVSQDKKHGLGI